MHRSPDFDPQVSDSIMAPYTIRSDDVPSKTDVLSLFKKDDLLSVATALGLDVAGSKDAMVEVLGKQTMDRMVEGLPGLARHDLNAACRKLSLDDGTWGQRPGCFPCHRPGTRC